MGLQFQNKWISIQKKMQHKDLTLNQLRSLEDEALLLLPDSGDVLGEEIIGEIQKRREGLCKPLKIGEFSQEEPLAYEFDRKATESTFSSRMKKIASMIRKENSLCPYKENLSPVQQREIREIAGQSMSPEGLSWAIDLYVAQLRKQVKVAESFYFGRMRAGMKGLLTLSDKVRGRVEEMVWQVSQGLDVSPEMISAALIHSVEEQMGMHENTA